MSSAAIDFSSIGGRPVAPPTPIDFSSIGGKPVTAYGGSTAGSASVPSGHWLSATADQLEDYAKGFGQGALQTTTAVSRLLNKIPGIGETLAPSQGVRAMRQLATPQTTAERLGAGTEQAAELLLPVGKVGTAAKIGIGALQGAGSVAAHEAGTTQGINPTDVGIGAAFGAMAPAAEGAIRGLANSKLARGAVNESMMASARDVAYGNPAKALLNENIATPFTGDLEAFKDAVRNGATLQGAADAAGGRIAAVSDRINQLKPQLDQVLAASKSKIPANVLTDPIDRGIAAIQADRGITAQDAQSAISELQAMKQAALKVPTVPGATATSWAPLEANAVKNDIGGSINWAGKERVGELVDPIRRQVYGNLKNAINQSAPGSAQLNERLTNLYAAQEDINKLAGFEEVGRGRSMGGVIGPSWMGRAEALAGRFIPAISRFSPSVGAVIRSTTIPTLTQTGTQAMVPLSSLVQANQGEK